MCDSGRLGDAWTVPPHGPAVAAGRPSIDPVVLFKLELAMFFEGIRSERQLTRLVVDRLVARWYIGYDLGEAWSDQSVLTRIRARGDQDTSAVLSPARGGLHT